VAPDRELQAYIEQHHLLWRCAREQSLGLEKLLAEQQRPFTPEVERLQTIPGVGPIVALTVIAVFSDVTRFVSAKHAASYAGLTPSTYQSGERAAHGRITKRGSGEWRAMLCEAAHHAQRSDHPLNPYLAKLRAKRGYRMAVIAVAHRLCRIMFAMLRQHTDFDVGKLGIEVGPFTRTTVRRYRLKPAQVASR
jgi:transposase